MHRKVTDNPCIANLAEKIEYVCVCDVCNLAKHQIINAKCVVPVSLFSVIATRKNNCLLTRLRNTQLVVSVSV